MSPSMQSAARRGCGTIAVAVMLAAAAYERPAVAQALPASAAAPVAEQLFAVEIKTGPAWDASKPPQDQLHFRDHSAHLRRLREQGALVMGARYGDKGLVVLKAASEPEARALMQADPSMQARVFAYELHEFRVFYGGSVAAPARRP